jgi:hypothetical protein
MLASSQVLFTSTYSEDSSVVVPVPVVAIPVPVVAVVAAPTCNTHHIQQPHSSTTSNGLPATASAVAADALMESPRKRRTGLHTVMERPPEINPDLVQEVENRMRVQAASAAAGVATATTPKTSPNKPASLRARRTGLSTVMEVKSLRDAAHSLNPPCDRFSPDQRRLSDPFRCNSGSSDASPCDAIRVMQEEAAAARLVQNEGASSADSASSGYMSPHFLLRPPSPSDDLHLQPRRSSDSGVDLPSQDSLLRNSASVPSKPIQQLYDEMYMDPSSPAVTLNNSRRYSYPNSPVHNQPSQQPQQQQPPPQPQQPLPQVQVSITHHLQQLRLHQKIEEEEAAAAESRTSLKWKGSITQGVPSRPPTASPTTMMTSLGTPHIIAHSRSFDEAFEHSMKPRGISGSASSLWQPYSMCSNAEDNEVDYISLPFTPASTAASMIADSYNNPEICVTNVTGDEIKYVFGTAAAAVSAPGLTTAEPMDHS